MTSIGDTLRRERQKRNLDVAKIAGELRISARFLEAMEADDFSKLPGGVFTKSFVRQYASFLGLNADELVSHIEPAVPAEIFVETVAVKHKPDVPGLRLGSSDSWSSIGSGRPGLPPWFRAGALLVLLMLVSSGIYWWWERTRHPVLAGEAPSARVLPPQQPAQLPPTPALQPVETPPATSTPASLDSSTQPPATPTATTPVTTNAPAASSPSSAPNPNASVRVGVTAEEAVWIRAELNGKVLFTGILQPHESRNFDGDGEVKIRLGNAGGASITLNGASIGPVGPKGQVRTVQLTSGGSKILSPPISFDPLDRL